MTSVAAVLRDTGLLPLDALKEAITAGQKEAIAAENLKALEQSVKLI